MILYTWVGDDGLVRWSGELPDNKWQVRDHSAGVIGPVTVDGERIDGYAALMRNGLCVDPLPYMDMALALAYWDDV